VNLKANQDFSFIRPWSSFARIFAELGKFAAKDRKHVSLHLGYLAYNFRRASFEFFL